MRQSIIYYQVLLQNKMAIQLLTIRQNTLHYKRVFVFLHLNYHAIFICCHISSCGWVVFGFPYKAFELKTLSERKLYPSAVKISPLPWATFQSLHNAAKICFFLILILHTAINTILYKVGRPTIR